MKIRLLISIFSLFMLVGSASADQPGSFYGISAKTIDGEQRSLADYRDKVVLVVNVASFCGYTSQYAGLENLYQRYRERGFVILGFPSNDFGSQEPGSDAEIKKFCSERYHVSFPIFSKVKVLGAEKHPLYLFLTSSSGGKDVGWNFEKFLIGKSGRVIERFDSGTTPEDPTLLAAIDKALNPA